MGGVPNNVRLMLIQWYLRNEFNSFYDHCHCQKPPQKMKWPAELVSRVLKQKTNKIIIKTTTTTAVLRDTSVYSIVMSVEFWLVQLHTVASVFLQFTRTRYSYLVMKKTLCFQYIQTSLTYCHKHFSVILACGHTQTHAKISAAGFHSNWKLTVWYFPIRAHHHYLIVFIIFEA